MTKKRRIGLKAWLSKEEHRAAVHRCGLAGCPEGGWGETEAAKGRIFDELPFKDERAFTVHEVVDALFVVNKITRRYEPKED
jgi:hypothetical protein